MADYRFPVEAGHILMFARAIGDDNPVYADPVAAAAGEAGGIIAPPTFAQAAVQFEPNFRLRPQVGKPWVGSGKTPSGVVRNDGGSGPGGLHAEQHFEYHRHPKPGDVLTPRQRPGKTWEKEGRRSGKLIFTETVTEYRDQHGELVITARSVVVATERPVSQD